MAERPRPAAARYCQRHHAAPSARTSLSAFNSRPGAGLGAGRLLRRPRGPSALPSYHSLPDARLITVGRCSPTGATKHVRMLTSYLELHPSLTLLPPTSPQLPPITPSYSPLLQLPAGSSPVTYLLPSHPSLIPVVTGFFSVALQLPHSHSQLPPVTPS